MKNPLTKDRNNQKVKQRFYCWRERFRERIELRLFQMIWKYNKAAVLRRERLRKKR